MPAPITPGQIANTVPSASASLCDKIKAVLLELPALLRDFFGWMLADDGSLSDEFKAEATSDLYQAGDLKWSAVATITTGWLLCNGQAVLRSAYPALFAAIGTTYGAGDSLTTFNVPDARGRALIAVSPSHALATTGGEETHTQTIAEMPSHDHTYGRLFQGGDANNGGANGVLPGSATTDPTGGGQPFNIMQPYLVGNLLIKT